MGRKRGGTRLYLLLLTTLALITAEGLCENNLRDKGTIWAKVACYDTMTKKEILSRKRISFLQREQERSKAQKRLSKRRRQESVS
jgi:hypothetical protein